MSLAEEPERKPFTDVDGQPLKLCELVEVLKNGIGPPDHVFMAKVVLPGAWQSVIEYDDGRRIEKIDNKRLRVRW